MKQFLKFTFASMLGFFLSLFFLMVIFLIFTFAILSTIKTTESVTVSSNTILELELDYEIPERTSTEPAFSFSNIPSFDKKIGMNDLVRLIDFAKDDPNIKGIYLNLDNVYVGSLTKINTIRNSIFDFKKSNKFVIAHGNSIDEKAFFLATAADSIYLTPTGSLEFNGFGIEVTFFKKALDKLEIEPQIFQYGKFKSATEPFKFDKLSAENKLQLNDFLASIYNSHISSISKSLNIEESKLKDIAANLLANSAEAAKELGLVSNLLYDDQVDTVLNKLMDKSLEVNYISSKNYLSSVKNSSTGNDRIAVIYALGEILENEGDEFTIGKENIIKSIIKAKENNKIKAIVMRVNSPGGSPLTSEMIWREIKLAAKEKPFIVSMSDIAASGGYYISCGADKIVAEPTTLAGSIGVFGIIPNTKDFFDNKLGITFDRVLTEKNSNLFSFTTPLNSEQKNFIQKKIDNVYNEFISRVAEGRKMSFEQVDSIAQGRIWSGIQAKVIGLVDTLGSLNDAINIAANLAKISDYKIIEYPTQKEPFEKIMELVSSEVENKVNSKFNNEYFLQINKLKEALTKTGIQTRLPFDYKIN
jgi:protease-4